MLTAQRSYSVLSVTIPSQPALPNRRTNGSTTISQPTTPWRSPSTAFPHQRTPHDGIHPQELSARIADSFQEFSSMLNKMNAAKQPERFQVTLPYSPESRRESTSSLPAYSSSPASQVSPAAAQRISKRASTPVSIPPPIDAWAAYSLPTEPIGPHPLSTQLDIPTPPLAIPAPEPVSEEQLNLRRTISRAASYGHAKILKEILTSPSFKPLLDINAADDPDDGTTPLIYASCLGHLDCVKVLLDHGAQVDGQDKKGWSALMWAAINGHTSVMRLLLSHGASTDILTEKGWSVYGIMQHESTAVLAALPALPPKPKKLQEKKAKRVETKEKTTWVDPIEFYYGTTFDGYNQYTEAPVVQPSRRQSTDNDQDSEDSSSDSEWEEEELENCEALMESIHSFVWDECLLDQMLVFSQEDIAHILDIAIGEASISLDSRQDMWVPANIMFLCCRFAYYYSSRELLNLFLEAAMARISKTIKTNSRDVDLVFWMANLSQMLGYLDRDEGLGIATMRAQEQLGELVRRCYELIVADCERQLDKVIEPGILDHEAIQGMEEVNFANDWHRFFRRRSRHSIIQDRACESPGRIQSPCSVVNVLSSIVELLQSYCVQPEIISQMVGQLMHYLSCEMSSRIVNSRKYLCRSKALQIRMNLSSIEEWVRKNKKTVGQNGQTNFFGQVLQLLQFLQCLSQLSDTDIFIETLKSLDLLTPAQVKRCVLNYRYEITEPRLSEEIEKYVVGAVEEHTTRSRRLSLESFHSDGSYSARRDSVLSRPNSRPDSVSSMASFGSGHGYFPNDTVHEDNYEESRTGKRAHILFVLPEPRLMEASRAYDQPTDKKTGSKSVSETMYEEYKQKLLEADQERNPRDREVIPIIPEVWIHRLDKKMVLKK
ncbi:hypothetical protein CLU79DRAFT_271068 [Phycomyces nitens]|nr:hypothetical protein CLU79DRAFT_271068 [Phycomyces nitens]